MGLVGALLAMKVALAIPPRPRRWPGPDLGLEAFHARPGVNQGAIDREVIAGKQRLYLGQTHQRGEEFQRHIRRHQPRLLKGWRGCG